MQYDASQQAAIEAAIDQGASNVIVTGGAGVGKTTVIKAIADSLGNCTIMAPTGKAAARLKEATGYDAGTIHRELMWDGKTVQRKAPFRYPVIVDESSMIGSGLMATMLKFNPPKLILVGDPAQLAPVERGQPFHDLITLRPDIVHELTHCWRAQGAVHKAAQAIRRGDNPQMRDNSGGESWSMIETGKAEPTLERIVAWCKAGHIDPRQDIILSPRYGDGESDAGIYAINKAVKDVLNPSVDKYAPGDRVIINKNFGPDDLWNGDLGTVTDINIEGLLWITLDRDPNARLLKKDQQREVAHAYALSVHKAQGSQFRRVIFIAQNAHWYQLSRSLVYTAVTRAQKGACVIGEVKAFYHAINTVQHKNTVMQWLGKQRVAA